MSKVQLDLSNKIDVDELTKMIGFISPDIIGVEKSEAGIEIEFFNDDSINKIMPEIYAIMPKYKKSTKNALVLYENDEIIDYYDFNSINEVKQWGDGQISLSEKGLFLLNYFDSVFCKIAKDMGAIEKLYPALLPMNGYEKTGYIRKTPQYSIFCSTVKDNLQIIENIEGTVKNGKIHEVVKEPLFALSPSACFHTYMEYEDEKLSSNTIITFKQNVFRNEGRLNYDEIGRLCDYHVREMVFIGDDAFVESCRTEVIEKSKKLLSRWLLKGDISLASDSFIVPKMQVYRKFQQYDKSKYEMHLNISNDKAISVASFNIHGKAFTDPFNISVNSVEDAVTGCVGFGLQRWVISFLCQHGSDERNWPDEIAEAYNLSKKRK